MRKITTPLLRAWRTVSPFGRALLLIGALCWLAGAWWAWKEFVIFAAVAIALIAIASLFTIGRIDLVTHLRVEPSRVIVGERAAGALTLRNNRKRSARAMRVELPVGKALAVFSVPSLPAGGEAEELFVVPTNRRAVIPVGPTVTVQGDPLGILRRQRSWSAREEIFVHPVTVGLSTMAAGLIRDLEGQTTAHLSPSDIAFHTLRDYVPGDDRRHVHWKSSAKTGRLMVRQYVDTRRSHIAVLLSTDLNEYASEDEFELAVSCAASVCLQAFRDDQTISVFVGEDQLPTANPKALLDRFSAIEGAAGIGGTDICLQRARQAAADASVAVVCLGSKLGVPEIRRAATRVAFTTTSVVVRAEIGSTASYRVVGSSRFVNVPELKSLNAGLERVLQ
jgi:uncharacterized protein (DUF58 family)